jgi:hypothetical protein
MRLALCIGAILIAAPFQVSAQGIPPTSQVQPHVPVPSPYLQRPSGTLNFDPRMPLPSVHRPVPHHRHKHRHPHKHKVKRRHHPYVTAPITASNISFTCVRVSPI